MERHDLTMSRGATFHRVLRFKQNGEPVDLSGYTAKSQVRVCPDGGELIAEMEATVTALSGRVDLVIPASVSAEFESGVYAWDIKLTSPYTVVEYYIGGKFTVLPTVTD